MINYFQQVGLLYPWGFPYTPTFLTIIHQTYPLIFLEIGPTSGITMCSRFANDKFIINSHHIFAERDGCGSLAGGGEDIDNGGAGVFHLK